MAILRNKTQGWERFRSFGIGRILTRPYRRCLRKETGIWEKEIQGGPRRGIKGMGYLRSVSPYKSESTGI